ncbi:MAG: hypothetical protein AAGF11_30100 [Myxococcota bacterium]
MRRSLAIATFFIFTSIASMGAFCAPAPQSTQEPTPQPDNSDTNKRLFTQQYEALEPTIAEYFSKIEIEEAQYQDWNGRVGDKQKQKATYPVVEKQHGDLVARTEAAREEYDSWKAYFEAHKQTGLPEEQNELSISGQALQQSTIKIFSDYGQLKITMMQIAPLHDM